MNQYQLFYQEKGYYIGDIMPFEKNGVFYLFQLRDERGKGPITSPFGWALTTTTDFVHYEDRGTVIQHGDRDDHDYFLFSGSVFEDRNGLFHAFYTGFNPTFRGTDRPSQITMHAESHDLLNWTKTGVVPGLEPQPGYNPDDWRDPFVEWDEANNEYRLYLGARDMTSGDALNGCTVYFASDDLVHFRFGGKLYAPGMYTMHEMPDLFSVGNWRYLIISEYSDRNRTVYRMQRASGGPWLIPQDDCFDGRAYYAARTFAGEGKRILFGWVPTRKADMDTGDFEWGGTIVPHEVVQRSDGMLGVRMPDSMRKAFPVSREISPVKIGTRDAMQYVSIDGETGSLFMLEGRICLDGTGTAYIRFYANPESGEGYQYVLSAREQRIWFEKSPNSPWFQCLNIGVDRVFCFETDKEYDIRLLVDGSVAVLYVDDVALSTRMCSKFGGSLQVAACGCTATFTGLSVSKQ